MSGKFELSVSTCGHVCSYGPSDYVVEQVLTVCYKCCRCDAYTLKSHEEFLACLCRRSL